MRNHGAVCSPEDFQSEVNVTFHKYESEVYDELHLDMWESLPLQFQLLAGDVLEKSPGLSDSLAMLDIGCGTGLASDCLKRTALGKRITTIDLLDTSANMLLRASQRAKTWSVPFRCIEGLLGAANVKEHYDLIVMCSVLHHIPDLPEFLKAIQRLQTTGGIFLHLQDPNGDYLADSVLRERIKQAEKESPQPASRFHPRRVLGRLYRELTGTQRNDYIAKTNRELLERGIIKSPLAVPDLFSVTDIHVNDGQGISLREIGHCLPDYELISERSYGFSGKLGNSMSEHLRKQEERLIADHALNGFHLAAAWRKA